MKWWNHVATAVGAAACKRGEAGEGEMGGVAALIQ